MRFTYYRLHEVKKITKRYRKDVKLVIERLDRHGDPFRTVTMEVDTKSEVNVRPARPGAKTQNTAKSMEKQNTTNVKKPGAKRKTKAEKVLIIKKYLL